MGRWSQAQAATYLAGLDRAFALIADFPDLGTLRPEIVPPVRLYRHKLHVVVYRDMPNGIEILRVLHQRQDWIERLLE